MKERQAGETQPVSDATGEVDYHSRARKLQSTWGWFLALGVLMIAGGVGAVAWPDASTLATSYILGPVLAIAGVLKMAQALKVRDWNGFIWQELSGVVELVGGILIFFNPLKGALSIAILLALVFLVQGFLQVALAAIVRGREGAGWFALSGLVALLGGAAILFKIPYVRSYAPGVIAGLSFLVAGVAYAGIALTLRKAKP